MTIDCEMDLNITNLNQDEEEKLTGFSTKNPGLVLKVSLVNMQGETVLDTLVDYSRYIVFKKESQPPVVEPEAIMPAKSNKKKDKQQPL